jgi:hypothetical protein
MPRINWTALLVVVKFLVIQSLKEGGKTKVGSSAWLGGCHSARTEKIKKTSWISRRFFRELDNRFFVGKYWMVFLDIRSFHEDIGQFSRISCSYIGIGYSKGSSPGAYLQEQKP